MNNVSVNPCIRCGKQRIFVKTWKQKIGYSVITTTETTCPDDDCQKMVDQSNKKLKDRFEASALRRQQSLLHRKRKSIIL